MSHHYGEDISPLSPIPLDIPGETEAEGAARRITQREEARMSVNVKVSIPVERQWRDSMKVEDCKKTSDYRVVGEGGDYVTLEGEGQKLTFLLADLQAAVNFLKPPTKPVSTIYRNSDGLPPTTRDRI